MEIHYLFLVLLPAALAGDRLRVKVDISNDFSRVKADASGENEQILTDDEQKVFGISDDVLRNGVGEISRSKPDAVFVKDSQSSWSNIHRKYDYDEVTRDLEAERATVLNVESRPYVIATQEIINLNSFPSTIDVGIPSNIPDTISTSWGKFNGVNDTRTQVTYEIRFGDKNTRFHTQLPWGQDVKSSQLGFVSETGVRALNTFVQLGPKETVSAEFVATQITIDLLVKYEVDFDGDVVCHYADGNFFKKFDIETVLKKSNFPNNIVVSEAVRLIVHPDARLVVKRN